MDAMFITNKHQRPIGRKNLPPFKHSHATYVNIFKITEQNHGNATTYNRFSYRFVVVCNIRSTKLPQT